MPFISLRERRLDLSAAEALPEEVARLNYAVPVGYRQGVPVVAIEDPTDDLVLKAVSSALGRDALFVVATHDEIEETIEAAYSQPHLASVDDEEVEHLDATVDESAEHAAETTAEPSVLDSWDLDDQAGSDTEEPAPAGEESAPVVPAPVVAAPLATAPEPTEPVPAPEPEPERAARAEDPTPIASLHATGRAGDDPVDESSAPPARASHPTSVFEVTVALSTGDKIPLGTFDDPAAAKAEASRAMRALATHVGEEWPFLAGRFVRPDLVLSVDVRERPRGAGSEVR
jgi:hypothetical protein